MEHRYSAKDIAKSFVKIRKDNAKKYMTDNDMAVVFKPSHLESFLFVANSMHSKLMGHPLFPEIPRAYDDGPSYPSVRAELDKLNGNLVGFNVFSHGCEYADIETMQFLEKVYHAFASMPFEDFQGISHRSDAWKNAWSNDKLINNSDVLSFGEVMLDKAGIKPINLDAFTKSKEDVKDAHRAIYDVKTIAQALIDIKARSEAASSLPDERMFTKRHLESLIVLAAGLFKSITGRPLVNDPLFAWDSGPVFLKIYEALKGDIHPGSMVGFNTFRHKYKAPDFMTIDVLESIYHALSDKTADELYVMLLSKDLWGDAWKKSKFHPIDESVMKTFFDKALEEIELSAHEIEKDRDIQVTVSIDQDGMLGPDFMRDVIAKINAKRHELILNGSDNQNLASYAETVSRKVDEDGYVLDVLFFKKRDSFNYEYRLIDLYGDVHADPTSHNSDVDAYKAGIHAIECIKGYLQNRRKNTPK